jgi:hypothetical protein
VPAPRPAARLPVAGGAGKEMIPLSYVRIKRDA